MEPVNAIAKARFSSARPQRVNLLSDGAVSAELLCLEKDQRMPVCGPSAILYVVGGSGTLIRTDGQDSLPVGHVVSLDSQSTLANLGEQRLICLLFRIAP
jgi:hypothetical protein